MDAIYQLAAGMFSLWLYIASTLIHIKLCSSFLDLPFQALITLPCFSVEVPYVYYITEFIFVLSLLNIL